MDTSIPTPEEINAMSDQDYKVLENRIRRAAARQGLRLEKSRARDPRAIGYGTYQLVDMSTNSLTSYGGSSGYGLSLTEVDRELSNGIIGYVAAAEFIEYDNEAEARNRT
jgi:hypothetical protein